MNKTDKLIAVALGLLLAGYVWYSFKQSKKEAEAQAQYQRDLAAWEKAHPEEAARDSNRPLRCGNLWRRSPPRPRNQQSRMRRRS